MERVTDRPRVSGGGNRKEKTCCNSSRRRKINALSNNREISHTSHRRRKGEREIWLPEVLEAAARSGGKARATHRHAHTPDGQGFGFFSHDLTNWYDIHRQ